MNFHFQIPCPLCDDNDNIAAIERSCPPDGRNTMSPLLETTCIILPPLFFQQHDKSQPSFILALELVSQAGFDIQGLRMVFFSKQLATTLCHCFSEEYKVIVCKLVWNASYQGILSLALHEVLMWMGQC